jgi:hypothetical protein
MAAAQVPSPSAVTAHGARCDGKADDAPALLSAARTGVVVVDCQVRVASDAGRISVPFRFARGGSLELAAGGSITIDGALEAPLTRIFQDHGGGLRLSDAIPVAYPQWWGAMLDGVTGDSAALNRALATGRPVQVGTGSILLDATVYLPSNATLRGEGRRTVFIVPDKGFAGERVITNSDVVKGNTNITLQDFALRVTSPTPVAGERAGILRLEKVDGLVIRSLYTDAYDSAITAVDLSGGIRNAVVSGCDLRNAHASRSGGALWVRGGRAKDAALDSRDVEIRDNHLESAWDEALALYGWFNTIARVNVSGNTIINRGPTQLAIGILGYNVPGQSGSVEDVVIARNLIVGKTHLLTGARRITLTANSITGPSRGEVDAILANFHAAGEPTPSDVTIEANVITGATRYGIYAVGEKVQIRRNRILQTKGFGLYVGPGTVVEDNALEGCGGESIHATGQAVVARNTTVGSAVGIDLVGQTSGSVVAGNTVLDATHAGIRVRGNGEEIRRVRVVGNRLRLAGARFGIRAEAGPFVECVAEENVVDGAGEALSLPQSGWRTTVPSGRSVYGTGP